MRVNVLYFASVRERVGTDSEQVEVPGEDCRVRDVIDHLRQRGGVWSEVFRPGHDIRFAVDQEFAGADSAVPPGAELAIFPPITGG